MRAKPIRFGVLTVTEDTATAVQQLMNKCKEYKLDLYFEQPILNSEYKESHKFSLIPAGREIWLNLVPKNKRSWDDVEYQKSVFSLWSLAIPLGFTPLNRNPIPDDPIRTQTFHYLGPWQRIYDHLIAEGRGDVAWSSLCCAAQCDVGAWKGDRITERSLQAQLHRIGVNCGSIDGNIGPRTINALQSLGMKGMKLMDILLELEKRTPAPIKTREKVIGHLVIPNRELVINCFGGISHTRTSSGITLIITESGRLVVDVK